MKTCRGGGKTTQAAPWDHVANATYFCEHVKLALRLILRIIVACTVAVSTPSADSRPSACNASHTAAASLVVRIRRLRVCIGEMGTLLLVFTF